MKKIAYYISPFIITTSVFMIVSLFYDMKLFETFGDCACLLFLFSIVLAVLSPSKTRFDYVTSVLVPLSVFFAMFIALIFDKWSDRTIQLWIPIAVVMTINAFVFSYKPIRDFIKSKFSLYHAIPFIVFPLIFLATDLAIGLFYEYEKDHILMTIRISLKISLVLFSAIIGSLSKSDKKFDFKILAIIPASFFITLFDMLLFDNGCNGLAFCPPNAFRIEFYIQYLPILAVITATTLLASFKPIRISNIFSRIKEK